MSSLRKERIIGEYSIKPKDMMKLFGLKGKLVYVHYRLCDDAVRFEVEE